MAEYSEARRESQGKRGHGLSHHGPKEKYGEKPIVFRHRMVRVRRSAA